MRDWDEAETVFLQEHESSHSCCKSVSISPQLFCLLEVNSPPHCYGLTDLSEDTTTRYTIVLSYDLRTTIVALRSRNGQVAMWLL